VTGVPAALLVSAVEHLPAGRALDLACGAGRHALFLARRGWRVTAVDSSREAIGLLREQAGPALSVDARVADLEAGEFRIEPDTFDLICDFCYLQRSLFSPIRAGIRPGGLFVAAIHMMDAAPEVKPMNPAYLLQPGELQAEFAEWEVLHYAEAKPEVHRRRIAELAARRPAPVP
jgi:SAM-dependent methyltransferase